MKLLRWLGAAGVTAGGGLYLASFYAHVAPWTWSGVAIVAAGAGAVVLSRPRPVR